MNTGEPTPPISSSTLPQTTSPIPDITGPLHPLSISPTLPTSERRPHPPSRRHVPAKATWSETVSRNTDKTLTLIAPTILSPQGKTWVHIPYSILLKGAALDKEFNIGYFMDNICLCL
ncbi:unnamed protein product [Arabis nemorensis]|uniref:Uncharacterized protein n=1 Tax=Arabis nemorensis TaxID=586526 RepID=A0A565BHB1_9BRAS|nr:unnamed protein product [Arabis nemorensis]